MKCVKFYGCSDWPIVCLGAKLILIVASDTELVDMIAGSYQSKVMLAVVSVVANRRIHYIL